ncbi:hypothetical protein [Flavobacterium sp. 3HN19-14]|uniref:hypothetical protein n=1 Tax=Flavobacterium sp. 3HN19-14 TaxID=3448133 RepID=UPI003EE10569
MKEIFAKYSKVLQLIFRFSALLYILVSYSFFYFHNPEASGDEWLFISDLSFINTHGWIAAIEKNISIPHMLVAWPFSFFLKEYVALRLVNFLLALCLIGYFYKIAKIRSLDFYACLFFFLATSAVFTIGTNDTLFFVSLIIFASEVYFFLENKKMNNEILAFSALVTAFFTRQVFLPYLPMVLLAFAFLYKEGFVFFNRKKIIPLLLCCFFLLLNIPCLQKNGKLSYDDKQPPAGFSVNWKQRQYLAQLMVNKGEIRNFSHPSWEETQAYVDKNGPDSLPDSIIGSILFNPKATVIEFFKDFYYSLFFGFRQLGMMLVFPLLLLLYNLWKNKWLNPEMFVPYSLLAMISVFSLIVFSYIEPRWLIAVFVMAIVFYNKKQTDGTLDYRIALLNYLILTGFSFMGMYGILTQLP